jgi:hypothetical protein
MRSGGLKIMRDAGGPILRTMHNDLAVMIRGYSSRPGCPVRPAPRAAQGAPGLRCVRVGAFLHSPGGGTHEGGASNDPASWPPRRCGQPGSPCRRGTMFAPPSPVGLASPMATAIWLPMRSDARRSGSASKRPPRVRRSPPCRAEASPRGAPAPTRARPVPPARRGLSTKPHGRSERAHMIITHVP